MIPKSSINIKDIKKEESVSRTYKIDFKRKRIIGFTDGIDSVKQAVYKILNTERYEHLIYGFYYGAELESLVGKEFEYVRGTIRRRLEEALLQDDRITSIEEVKVNRGKGKSDVTVEFEVRTKYGDFNVTQEVVI